MKRKFILLFALNLLLFVNYAFAEQAAAEKYRQIFQSGTFYLEYKDSNESKVLAEFDNKRMERIKYIKMNWVTYFNPLGALFGGSGSKCPEVLYQNGKYYQFIDEDAAIVLSEDKLNDENLDPRQGWNLVKKKLAVPSELSVFYWNDPYRQKTSAINSPKFSESKKKRIGNKEYDCDVYISEIKGMKDVRLIYETLYIEGNLVEIHSSILQNEILYPVNKLQIKKILGEIPKGAFKIDKKTKIYSAGVGDMYDLTSQLVQVENLGVF